MMMRWTIILLFVTHLMTVHCQTWVGTYIVNSTCAVSSCCCLSNSIVIASPSPNILTFSTDLTGDLCEGYTSYFGQTTYPTGYTGTVTIIIVTLNITLSTDSNILTITSSLGSTCGEKAVRESDMVETTTTVHGNAAEQYINILILLILPFLSIVITF